MLNQLLFLFLMVCAVTLSSPLDGLCCCTPDEVNRNSDELRELLDIITQSPFFRYFRVNTHKECPYWLVSLLCTAPPSKFVAPCSICTCSDEEVPIAIINEDQHPTRHDDVAARLDRRSMLPVTLAHWGGGEDHIQRFLVQFQSGPMYDGDEEYVNLLDNPESFTNYSGVLSHNVWSAIYDENCFFDDLRLLECGPLQSEDARSSQGPPHRYLQEDSCTEQIVMYRLLSGLHASISSHLSVNYYFQEDTPPDKKKDLLFSSSSEEERSQRMLDGRNLITQEKRKKFLPNCKEFRRRVLNHKDRIDNLYFLLQFVLRATARAATSLFNFRGDGGCNIGDVDEDLSLQWHLQQLFAAKLLCCETFNETVVLESPTAATHLPRMMSMLYNITQLMDCVACEKCRVWGKLQTIGLQVAFKLLLSSAKDPVELSRTEKVALLNFLRQVAMSVHYVNNECAPPFLDDL